MVRFSRKGSQPSLRTNGLAERPSHTSLWSLPTTGAEHRSLTTWFTFWPGGTAFPPSTAITVDKDLSSTPASPDSLHDCSFKPNTATTTSSRRPRHVPIIIPDDAQPFAPRRLPSPAIPLLASTHRSVRDLPPNPRLEINASCSTHSPSRDAATVRQFDRTIHTKRTMNSSQVSLSASESGADPASGPSAQRITGGGSTSITSPITPSIAGGANLSGLVCNVHRTTGEEPHALVGATTTILGDKLYVFGGRVHSHSRSRAQLTSDLYELDLIRRHWTKLQPTGDIPPPRYFHSACALGDTKIVCYGGMSPAPHLRGQVNGQPSQQTADGQPEVVVMSDLHIFDVLTARWHLIAVPSTGTDAPQGRYAHCTAILPSSAVFASSTAPHSAIQHNRSSSDAHSGTLGVQLDGTGGTEMIVVGGQDSANNYIEQISVFNLRSLKWTSVTGYDRKCGAYKSMVAPLIGLDGEAVGRGVPLDNPAQPPSGTSMLIYSNYNFLDVKLELQVRLPDGSLIERQMAPGESPPGLRFPNGGVLNSHFVVSGTYLTSSKHEYALWALDLRTLSWHRIDTAGSVFSTGSWNRGVLWSRRNQFVVLGHRKRSLVDDYNHRRINFSHVCMVELEAFGLYDNPRKLTPTSSYLSRSAPVLAPTVPSQLSSGAAGGRQLSNIAEQLGTTAMTMTELSDMDLVAMEGERVPCNSRVLAKRWGPYFSQLMLESATAADSQTLSDTATLRTTMHSQASRNSALTITPTGVNGVTTNSSSDSPGGRTSVAASTTTTLVDPPTSSNAPPASRSRSLYLPHTVSTIRLLLYYLYNSSLPAVGSPLCSPHTLCSLLQMARPYQIDGLLEATVQRLHEALDGRNAAAVFNAAAMAAGGGSAVGLASGGAPTDEERSSPHTAAADRDSSGTQTNLHRNTSNLSVGVGRGHHKSNSQGSNSTAASAGTSTGLSQTDVESNASEGDVALHDRPPARDVWTGEISSVIGLQKRGLRGLMEGRRLRESARPNIGASGGTPTVAESG